jgi:hypothetical protein
LRISRLRKSIRVFNQRRAAGDPFPEAKEESA